MRRGTGNRRTRVDEFRELHGRKIIEDELLWAS